MTKPSRKGLCGASVGIMLALALFLLTLVALARATTDHSPEIALAPVPVVAVPEIEVTDFVFPAAPAMSKWPWAKAGEVRLALRLRDPLPVKEGPQLLCFSNCVQDGLLERAPDVCFFSVSVACAKDDQRVVRLVNATPQLAPQMALLLRNILASEKVGKAFAFELVECGKDEIKEVSLVFDFKPPL